MGLYEKIVNYESTVYPGVTEDICIPILERESGLKCGVDFKVGYSPERINPGDKKHTLETIKKIVSAIDDESLDEIAKIYSLVIKAGVHKTSSIKVAEAAKVVENSQRDINIAFMNELAMVFDRMGIDTKEVIDAMNTKWNALGFYPGLVGGHCIGVDPYYFIYQAEKLGYHSQIILSGRKINDGMGEFIANTIIKKLIHVNKVVKKSKVVIFGITYKENCPDTRNSKVVDIIKGLNEYGIEPIVVGNFLIPKGLAVEATAANINIMQTKKEAEKNRKERELAQAKELAEKLKGIVVTLKAKAGENGKLFGSMTSKDVSDYLKKQHNLDIDKKKISLPESMKSLGTYEAEVKLYPGVSAKLTVKIEQE